jgi:2-methylcitrate dehydratase PrpD
VANSLARGSAQNKDYTAEAVRDREVQALIGRVRLALAELPRSEGVELEIRTKDGRRFMEYVDRAQGDPDRPLSRASLIDKFMEQVDFTHMVSRKKAEKLLEMLEDLEGVDNVQKIVRLAVKDQ